MVKRTILWVALVMLVSCGSAAATGYTYTGGGTATHFDPPGGDTDSWFTLWDDAANWNPSKPGPGTTADNYVVGSYGAGQFMTIGDNQVRMPAPGAGNWRYFGTVKLDNGQFSWGAGNFKFASDNGQSGDFTMGGNASNTYQAWGADVVLDIDGDFKTPSGTPQWGGLDTTIIMRDQAGDDATYQAKGYGGYHGSNPNLVIVDNGATVNFSTAGGATNPMQKLEIWGTATGSVRTAMSTSAERVFVYGGGDASGLNVERDNAKNQGDGANDNTIFLQGHFQDVQYTGMEWHNGGDTRHYATRLPGDLHVRNLSIGSRQGGDATLGVWYLIDTDNDDAGSKTSNLTVDQNLQLGHATLSYSAVGILKVNSATVDVGGDVIFYSTTDSLAVGSYMLGGTGNIMVGGDWTVMNPAKSGVLWDMGTSTVTFDGSAQTIKAGNEVPFHNVIVNQTGSTLQLDDNMVLTGDLTFLSASTVVIPNELNAIIFKGGIDNEADAQLIDVGGADLINVTIAVLNPPSYVKLMSDLNVSDNLNMEAGTKLFLNGYALTVGGQDVGPGAWDDGMIVGTGVIPEPATLLLLGTGLLGALGVARRRRMK